MAENNRLFNCAVYRLFRKERPGGGCFAGEMSAVMYSLMVIFNKKADRTTWPENSTLLRTPGLPYRQPFTGRGLAVPLERRNFLCYNYGPTVSLKLRDTMSVISGFYFEIWFREEVVF